MASLNLTPRILALTLILAPGALDGCQFNEPAREAPKTDHEITIWVEAKLISLMERGASHIRVITDEGMVHLTGHVSSDNDKAAAETIARHCRAARAIVNELEVSA